MEFKALFDTVVSLMDHDRIKLRHNSIRSSLDSSPSLLNCLGYGGRGEDPAVRQESDNPTSCHLGRRDGRLLNSS